MFFKRLIQRMFGISFLWILIMTSLWPPWSHNLNKLNLPQSKSENKSNTFNVNITDYLIFHQKIFKPPNSNFPLSELSPLGREQDNSLEITWKLSTQWCFVLCLFTMVLLKKMMATKIRKPHSSHRLRWAEKMKISLAVSVQQKTKHEQKCQPHRFWLRNVSNQIKSQIKQ